MRIDVAKARSEIVQKGMSQIERETALAWAGRAVAAWELYGETGRSGWRDDAVEFASEAVEHSAQSGDDVLLRDVRRAIAEAAGNAFAKRPDFPVPWDPRARQVIRRTTSCRRTDGRFTRCR